MAPVFQSSITIMLIAAFTIQIIFWLYRFNRFGRYKITTLSRNNPAVSVVICAKNELQNLKKTLEPILTQEYKDFEVILCDDFSTDNTGRYAENLLKNYPHFRYINADKDLPGKKHALAYAIARSNHETILVTDADCTPSSKYWIRDMVRAMRENTNFVLGYGPLAKLDGILNKFIRFESLFTAIQYMSAAIFGKPYMGVGRNMLFQKSVYQNYLSTGKAINTASGDDDLFVNQSSELLSQQVTMDKTTFMVSPPKETLHDFFKQKKRHISTSTYYSFSSQVPLVLYPLSHLTFYLSCIVLLFTPFFPIVVGFYFLRMLVLSFVIKVWMKKLNEEDLSWWIPCLDLCHGIYYIVMFPFLFINDKSHW